MVCRALNLMLSGWKLSEIQRQASAIHPSYRPRYTPKSFIALDVRGLTRHTSTPTDTNMRMHMHMHMHMHLYT